MVQRLGFNPRARVGRDAQELQLHALKGKVSIHAPAWGATRRSSSSMPSKAKVSIHAPAWGATCVISNKFVLIYKFQSTRPRGARRMTPARLTSGLTSFNPRARVGRDMEMAYYSHTFRCFNPRARVGRDQAFACSNRSNGGVSIHAPAWGATP